MAGSKRNSAVPEGKLRSLSSAEVQAFNNQNEKEACAFFESALNSSNSCIRTAASAELLRRFYEGREISVSLMKRLKRSAPPSWAEAFRVLEAEPAQLKKKALDFFLGSGQPDLPFFPELFPDEAALYTFRECLTRTPDIFTPAELAAINGNILASQSRFSEALNYFRITMDEPDLFFRYPDLLNRLGRAFQYSGAGNEGIELFLKWEKLFLSGFDSTADEQAGLIQFRLLFFAGRMARQQGRHDEGISFFYRALPLAPDTFQSDACIWYILDSILSSQSDNISGLLAELMPLWHDRAYYNDFLDKLISSYVLKNRWTDITGLFPLVYRYADTDSKAMYAYIIAQALDQGFLSGDDAARAIEEDTVQGNSAPGDSDAPGRTALVHAYMEIAYQSGSNLSYYHLMSAAFLKKPFLDLPGHANRGRYPQLKHPASDVMEFLRGFFSHKAAEYAPPYIRFLEKELKPDEKRYLARALSDAGLYAESMRLISTCADNDNGNFVRSDLEIYYPRPFREYIEKYAHENNLAPDLLFGLIRAESAFQSSVVSRAGAVGLTQLLPATAEEMAGRIRRQGGRDYTGLSGNENGGQGNNTGLKEAVLFYPEVNIHIGAYYLSYLADRMGSPLMALLAYNGGMNRVRRWRNTNTRLSEDLFLESLEFRETREYGKKVLGAQAVYKALYYADK